MWREFRIPLSLRCVGELLIQHRIGGFNEAARHERWKRFGALLSAERIEIYIAELREDHGVLEFARRGIAGARECHRPRVFHRQQAGAPFCRARTCRLLGLAGFQVALAIPIERNNDMIGDRRFHTDFRLSAEDFPERLSATTS